MKKTIEVEYVGIEDIQEIMDDAYALMREGHYVSVEIQNIGVAPRVNIDIWLGGWEPTRNKDYGFEFWITDNDTDVTVMNDCKHIIKSLLEE